MFQGPAAWGMAGLFLAVLILVRRFQTKLSSYNPEGFRYFSGGLSLLSLAALARLFHTEGMFDRIPFLSEPIFFDLAYWIGVIAGGSMVVNGASNWLPLTRKSVGGNADQIQSSDLLRRVQQLVGVENRIVPVLSNSLMYMKECAGLSCGAVFKFSRSHSRIELAATTPDFPIEWEELDEAVSSCFAGRRHEEKVVDLERCLADCLPSGLCRPAAVIPMEVNGRIVGSFVLWKQDGPLETQERLNLQLAADIVAHKIDRDQLLVARQSDRQRADWLVSLESSVTGSEGTVRKVAAMARGLANAVPYDALAITVAPGGGARTIRYSIASGGNVLVEKSVEAPLPGALTESVSSAGQTVVFGDLGSDRQPNYREIIVDETVRSLIAIPMRIGGEFVVTLTLASGRQGAYNRTNQRVLELLRPLLASVVQSDILDLTARRELARFEKLGQLAAMSTDTSADSGLVYSIACLAAEETGADVIRIARLDESGLFLESRVMVSCPGRIGSVPADGQMILALMPLHEQALRTGRLTVGRTRSEVDLTDMEAHQVFDDEIRQVAVMPLVHSGRVLGVITAAVSEDYPTILGEASRRVFLAVLGQVAAPLLAQSDNWCSSDRSNRLDGGRADSNMWTRRLSFVPEKELSEL